MQTIKAVVHFPLCGQGVFYTSHVALGSSSVYTVSEPSSATIPKFSFQFQSVIPHGYTQSTVQGGERKMANPANCNWCPGLWFRPGGGFRRRPWLAGTRSAAFIHLSSNQRLSSLSDDNPQNRKFGQLVVCHHSVMTTIFRSREPAVPSCRSM